MVIVLMSLKNHFVQEMHAKNVSLIMIAQQELCLTVKAGLAKFAQIVLSVRQSMAYHTFAVELDSAMNVWMKVTVEM